MYWNYLSEAQRKKCKDVFLALLSDKKAPESVRAEICWTLSLVIEDDYRSVILKDKNVVCLRDNIEKWRKLDELVRRGEVCLESKTMKELKKAMDEVEKFNATLRALLEDPDESVRVKERAKIELEDLAKLPVPPGL